MVKDSISSSPAQALLDKRSKHPLFTLEGVSTALVRHDSLHILYSRGVASHLAGSLLFYLCWYDWPRRQSVPASERLLRIFAKIKQIYSENNVPARLCNLKPSMVWDTSRPHKSFPCLGAKASETKHVLEPLEQVLKEVLEGEEAPIHITMCDCLHALNQLIKHFDSVGTFLTAHALEWTLPKGSLMHTKICTTGQLLKVGSCSISPSSSMLVGICSRTPST